MQRRQFIQTTGALALTLSLPQRLRAESSVELGAARIDIVSDGKLVLPADFNAPEGFEAALQELLERHDLSDDMRESPCNLVLLRDGPRVVLFDVGAGPDFMATTGQMLDSMDRLGVAPEEVTHLVLTHAHPDHLWGLLDDFDDLLLPNAAVMIGRAEFDYWMDPDTVESIGLGRQSFAVGAQRRLSAIADQVMLFDDGDEVLPGLQAVATFGHTPGHMSFAFESGGQRLMILGDALANPHLAFEHPDWPWSMDHDPETAAATRTRLLDRITADDMLIQGFHLPGGGIGHAEKRTADTYIFTSGA